MDSDSVFIVIMVGAFFMVAGVESALLDIGSGILNVTKQEATFHWDGIETDTGRLRAGVELLTSLGLTVKGGAYR